MEYRDFEQVLEESDLISLHCPLTDDNYHMINRDTIAKMKDQVILINTSRGALIDTEDLIAGIQARKFFGVGLDVYEEEGKNVFENREDVILENCVVGRLLSFPNVIVTSHQGFLTREALTAISRTTLQNAADFQKHCTGRKPGFKSVITKEIFDIFLTKSIDIKGNKRYIDSSYQS